MKVAGYLVLAVLFTLAYGAQMARWLRVLQREHYDPTSLLRFLGRWSSPPLSRAKSRQRARPHRPFTPSHALLVAMAAAIFLRAFDVLAVACVIYGLFCPYGLSIRGRTSPLEWTRRLRTTAILASVLSLVVSVLGALTPQPFFGAVVMVIAVPPTLDVVTRVLRPVEERHARVFVDRALQRLHDVHPTVVAITGSYGKTSTKNYLADLVSPTMSVVASPRSFNNRAGLSRAINENLAEGTSVFIAEMGTYGSGEIRALTSWCSPSVAVVTAIGPVHLERMKTLEVVEAAKREITEDAAIVVVNIDDLRLSTWIEPLRREGKRVVSAGSSRADADVRVMVEGSRWSLIVEGANLGTLDALVGVQPTNVACAMAAALALTVPTGSLLERVRCLSPVANRLNVVTAPSGVVVIDDTFNANPASAVAALATLASLELRGRRVVVTPGLVELGGEQYGENLRLANRVFALPAELVVVARTNAVALSAGEQKHPRRFDSRDEAVAWVRSTLVPGDGVLYLNDLPDHYP